MAKNYDPTRTLLLRTSFYGAIMRKLRGLIKSIMGQVQTENVFGLTMNQRDYEFLSDPQKLNAFNTWFDQQVSSNILIPEGDMWTDAYVYSAYKKGVIRAYTDTKKEGLENPYFEAGQKNQFVSIAMNSPVARSSLELLYLRAFNDMKGLTDAMKLEIGRILTDGLANGYGIKKIARNLRGALPGMAERRAKLIASTEIIRAHAEGQLDSFDLLDVQELGVDVEFSTAGDDRVCPKCSALEGKTFTVKEARGVIPVHPSCRCSWIPAEKRS